MTENEAIVFIKNANEISKKAIRDLEKIKDKAERIGKIGEYYANLENCYKEIESCEIAIKALEEIQQYRAIETEIRERYHANVDIKILMKYFIETIFKGENHEGFCVLTNEDAKMWEEYQAIGTVEECREAREKQRGKKPVKDEYNHECCPNCGWIAYQDEWGGRCLPHCENCGQSILWESDTP